MDKNEQNSIAGVRAARRRISERYGHDPKKLIEHYIEMQKQFQERLVSSGGKEGSGKAA
jgi:glycyl-tRNA synthetase alpha subunit